MDLGGSGIFPESVVWVVVSAEFAGGHKIDLAPHVDADLETDHRRRLVSAPR
jgi:hypothetical protein